MVLDLGKIVRVARIVFYGYPFVGRIRVTDTEPRPRDGIWSEEGQLFADIPVAVPGLPWEAVGPIRRGRYVIIQQKGGALQNIEIIPYGYLPY